MLALEVTASLAYFLISSSYSAIVCVVTPREAIKPHSSFASRKVVTAPLEDFGVSVSTKGNKGSEMTYLAVEGIIA